jgi:hypothetical protein
MQVELEGASGQNLGQFQSPLCCSTPPAQSDAR